MGLAWVAYFLYLHTKVNSYSERLSCAVKSGLIGARERCFSELVLLHATLVLIAVLSFALAVAITLTASRVQVRLPAAVGLVALASVGYTTMLQLMGDEMKSIAREVVRSSAKKLNEVVRDEVYSIVDATCEVVYNNLKSEGLYVVVVASAWA